MGMVEVAIAGGLLVALAVAATMMMSGMNRDMASLSSRGDLEEVKNVLRRRLNCQRTFPTKVCSAGANGLVVLKDDFGNDIFTDVDNGAEKPVFANTYKYGTARIRTQCGLGSVEIRLARYNKPDTAWPAKPTVETCQEVLGGVFTNLCPSGQDMRGVNPDTLEPICVPATFGCPVGTYLAGVSYDSKGSPIPDCRNFPADCPVGTYKVGMTVDAAGVATPNCRPFPGPSCPNGFVRAIDFTSNTFTCTDASDGSKFGGNFVIVSGAGAGDNKAFSPSGCGPGLVPPCGCAMGNSINGALGCNCPPGFSVSYTTALFDANPATNWGGSFGCTSDVSKGGAGCGWAMGMCFKSF